MKKAQFTLEYAFFIFIIVLALVAMYSYIRTAIMGKFREAADVFGEGREYEPGVTNYQDSGWENLVGNNG